ncbi:MAG TPA: tetratricopeptide repeat protein [Acidobacteriota bacterium]|nr:tetratricopeptide repeat protein [Acidobacteriota bacterium]
MRRVGALALIVGATSVISALLVERLAAQNNSAPVAQPATIVVYYPLEGSVFPPEIIAPTFLWRDAAKDAAVWRIDVIFGGRTPRVQARTAGERMRIGEIDPRCATETNQPILTPQQMETHTWTPDTGMWETIKKNSVKRPAIVAITGFRDESLKEAVSHGQVTIQTSKDPVGAPIFYRDVPLMPSEGEKGVIKPLPQSAIGLIKWRLRNIGEPQSRTVMENLPTCANCHSFSLDGKTLGLDVDGPQNDKGLYALISVMKEASIRNQDVIKWSSFRGKLGGKLRAAFSSQVSPDGRYVVTTIDDPEAQTRQRGRELVDKYYVANFKDYRFLQVFFPTRGILAWYSRETGHLQPLPGADDPRYVQTDGVWSPDGKYVVFARAEAKDPFPSGGKLAEFANDPDETQIQYDLYRVPFNGGKGGRPEPIKGASQNGMSNNFPKVSPDGRWIVFVQCRNGQLMRPDSQLHIVPFQGGEAWRMACNTSLMNSWHSFSPNGRWMVFSSKSRSPFTQMYLTHLDENGRDTPPILIDNATAANRAVNIPEFVNIPQDGLQRIDAPATEFFRVFDAAVDLARKNQVDAALVEWKKAVDLNPEEAKAHFNLALALDRKGQVDEAIVEYGKTIETDAENASAYTNLAVDLARTGKVDEAVDWLTKCLSFNPENAQAQSNLSTLLVQKGQFDRAIDHGQKAVDIEPDYADAHNSLGTALAMADRLDEAIPHLERAVAIAPDSFEYQFNLGRFLTAKGKFADAIAYFERAVQLSGGREPLSLDMLAAMYFETERYAEAVQAANRALDLAVKLNNQDLITALRARLAIYEAKASPQK